MRDLINLIFGFFGASAPLSANNKPHMAATVNHDPGADMGDMNLSNVVSPHEHLVKVNHRCAESSFDGASWFHNESSSDEMANTRSTHGGRVVSELNSTHDSFDTCGGCNVGRSIDSDFGYHIKSYEEVPGHHLNQFGPRKRSFKEKAIKLLECGRHLEALELLRKTAKGNPSFLVSEKLLECLFDQLGVSNYEIRRLVAGYIAEMPVDRMALISRVANFFEHGNVGIQELLCSMSPEFWDDFNPQSLILTIIPSLASKTSSMGYIRNLMNLFNVVRAKLPEEGAQTHQGFLIDAFSNVPHPQAQIYVYQRLLQIFPCLAESDRVYGRLNAILRYPISLHAQQALLNLFDALATKSNTRKQEYQALQSAVINHEIEPAELPEYNQLLELCRESLGAFGFISSTVIDEVINQLTLKINALPADKEIRDERLNEIFYNLELHSDEEAILELCKALVDKSHLLCRSIFAELFSALSTDRQLSLLFHLYPLQQHNHTLPHLLECLKIGFSIVDVHGSIRLDSIAIAFVSGNARNLEINIDTFSDGLCALWPKLGAGAQTAILRSIGSRSTQWRIGDKELILKALSECDRVHLSALKSITSQA